MQDRNIKFERIKSMPLLKREIISYLFDFVNRKKPDTWWHYNGEFKYQGDTYILECDVRMDNQMFTYRGLMIEHKQQVLEVEDVLRGNILNDVARVQ
jgi:hypothetical protein